MWIDPTFESHTPEDLAVRIIADHPLAVLVAGDPPRAAHMPLVMSRGASGLVLTGHVPLADPIAQYFDHGQQVLAVFPGPSAYVSPAWYATPGLPTYNYVPVHARGSARRLDDDALRQHLRELVALHEKAWGGAHPWSMDEHAEDRMDQLLPLILGFEVAVERLDVKAKLGQNRTVEDVRGTVTALSKNASPVAELMAEELAKRGPRDAT